MRRGLIVALACGKVSASFSRQIDLQIITVKQRCVRAPARLLVEKLLNEGRRPEPSPAGAVREGTNGSGAAGGPGARPRAGEPPMRRQAAGTGDRAAKHRRTESDRSCGLGKPPRAMLRGRSRRRPLPRPPPN